jgi:hypothetical protein
MGSIQGRVTGLSGAVLPGAPVTLNPNGLVTATGGRGEYSFGGLAAGDYNAIVTCVGFAVVTRTSPSRRARTPEPARNWKLLQRAIPSSSQRTFLRDGHALEFGRHAIVLGTFWGPRCQPSVVSRRPPRPGVGE